ncbi:MAG: hypothetical protein FJ104_00600 [Deltaproteobacteria bacterium]|nr:hypothetical protein [Deltaproteobacteria bacterium]
MSASSHLAVVALLLTAAACRREEDFTSEEVAQALSELEADSQAGALAAEGVEIGTRFTIGGAVQEAAEELRAFVATQLPCASVALSGGQLRVEYGANGVCLYRGRPFSGTHVLEVSRNAAAEVRVEHQWIGLSNGRLQLDGTATATWNLADPARRVEHELVWTRLSDGRTGRGSGERVQRPLEGGLAEGFSEEGSRRWVGERGAWDLLIDGVEVRWVDPVPQAGRVVLDTPFDKSLDVEFTRRDESTIRVTFQGPRREFSLDVRSEP